MKGTGREQFFETAKFGGEELLKLVRKIRISEPMFVHVQSSRGVVDVDHDHYHQM